MSRSAPIWSVPDRSAFLKGANLHTHLLRLAALDRGLEVQSIGHKLILVRAGTGQATCFSGRTIPQMGIVAHRIASNKIASARLLEAASLKTPQGRLFKAAQLDQALEHFRTLDGAAVVKPNAGSIGAGVSVDIRDDEHFRHAWRHARGEGGDIIVERFIRGQDHRIFVIGDHVVATIRRHPAAITGDGRHTVQELVELKSKARAAIPFVGDKPIALSSVMLRNLHQAGLSQDTVLKRGQVWQLHEIANTGAGGDSEDITDTIHPDFAAIAVAARTAIPGMGYAGVDLLAQDLARPAEGQDWGICEINSSPEFAMHHFPVIGQGRDVAGCLLDHALAMRFVPDRIARMSCIARIAGKVTGVGYRNWLRNEALSLNVGGWVRNVQDGLVECHLHGTQAAVETLLAACRRGPRKARPEEVRIIHGAVPEGEPGFVIRRGPATAA